MANKQKAEAVVPEPETESEPAAELEPAVEPEPETEPVIEPEAEPATPVIPSHEGKWISDVVPGDAFVLGGKRYRLRQMFGETAQVMLLATRKGQVAPKKYVDQEVGVEIIDMRGDTVIE